MSGRGADIDSNHEVVIADIKIKLKCRKKTNRLHRHSRLNVKLNVIQQSEKLLTSEKTTFGK